MPSESKKERLPFEPRQKGKKTPKAAPVTPVEAQREEELSERSLKAIPQAVSARMARRMAVFCGLPTGLGITSFFVFYWVVSQEWVDLPPFVVLGASLSLFGLGFLGLSYGIFSASWDEDRVGSWLGWDEFKVNFRQTIAAWRSGKKSTEEN
ncbi:MAG: hypothetical protein N5P05_003168 [Chroococcopsis gigantea SAG 12.99]|jgi:hypothetical protein|nr:PAM68 family protein [Chlorogloea purpurea SAG 13.99]MDV3001562.1 hypothetical protein [Chroococcopsis gigantea SAG 12.99]